MASPGGQSRGGTCVWRVSSRWEHTWARLGAPSAPKSILTPLKRPLASMALQRNYPLGNDISTQFLPASLSPGNDLLPQACRCRPSGQRWPQNSCHLIPEGCETEELWDPTGHRAAVIRSQGMSGAVLHSDWMWCGSVSCQDNRFCSSAPRKHILWKLWLLGIRYDNFEKCDRKHKIASLVGVTTQRLWAFWGWCFETVSSVEMTTH